MDLAQSQAIDSFPEGSHPGESAIVLGTETIQIEHLRLPPSEGNFHAEAAHTMFINLTPRPLHYLQQQDGKTHAGLYRCGEMVITPANPHNSSGGLLGGRKKYSVRFTALPLRIFTTATP